jgi:hypothetical protein
MVQSSYGHRQLVGARFPATIQWAFKQEDLIFELFFFVSIYLYSHLEQT